MYPFKDVFWEMEVLSDSLPSAHSLQSLSSVCNPAILFLQLKVTESDEGSPTTMCSNCGSYWNSQALLILLMSLHSQPSGDPQVYSVPFAHGASVPASSHHKNEHLPPSSTLFLGTWLVLPAMHLVYLLSTIKEQEKEPQ